jgi:SRSO17 transposase
LELLDRAMGNGVKFEWAGIDAGYGQDPQFLHELNRRNLLFVADVPPTFHGWLRQPEVMHKEFPGRAAYEGSGRKRKIPRLKVKNLRACSVKNLLTYSPDLRDQEWQKFHIKDTNKGPVVWEVKQSSFYFKLEKAITFEHRLVICRSVTEPDEIKYFVSNAPLATPLETILAVAFNRWRVEMCFREEKSELGLSHFEVRNYTSLLRHMIVTSVTHLFLAKAREKWKRERGEGEAPDREPAAHGTGRRADESPRDRSGAQAEIGAGGEGDHVPPAEHRGIDPVRQQKSPESPPSPWDRACEIAVLCAPVLEKAAL